MTDKTEKEAYKVATIMTSLKYKIRTENEEFIAKIYNEIDKATLDLESMEEGILKCTIGHKS